MTQNNESCRNFLRLLYRGQTFIALEDGGADVGVINKTLATKLGFDIARCYRKFGTANSNGSLEIVGMAKGRIDTEQGSFEYQFAVTESLADDRAILGADFVNGYNRQTCTKENGKSFRVFDLPKDIARKKGWPRTIKFRIANPHAKGYEIHEVSDKPTRVILKEPLHIVENEALCWVPTEALSLKTGNGFNSQEIALVETPMILHPLKSDKMMGGKRHVDCQPMGCIQGLNNLKNGILVKFKKKGTYHVGTEIAAVEILETRDIIIDLDEYKPTEITGNDDDDDAEASWKQYLGRDCSKDSLYEKFGPCDAERLERLWKEFKMDESDIVVNKRKYIESMGKSRYESFIDEVKQSISKLSHIFQTNPTPIDAEKHPEIEVGIETTGDPVRSKQYMLSPQCKNAVREFVSKLLKLKLIRKSSSPWASPLLAVRKPDGVSWRVCLDARKLNEQTVRMAYPMQRADEALRSLRGATIFSTCDATSGFWQLPLKEKDKKKTAFHSPLGLYEFEVMPFGLINAPSHFASAMDLIIGELKQLFVKVYVDDILTYNGEPEDDSVSDVERHLQQLVAVWQRCSMFGLQLKPSKCNLFRRSLKFLGHIVSGKGIEMDREKLEAIKKIPPPTSKTGVRSMMGALNFYRHFIKNFAAVAKPLNELLKDETPDKGEAFIRTFTCKPEYREAFERLKTIMTTAPVVLHHPDFEKPFEIHTDASQLGLGATLIQRDKNGNPRVIEYASTSVNDRERNYKIRELECMALIYACEKWRAYLQNQFVAVVDHANLLKLQEYVGHNRRLQTWATKIGEYDIKLKFKAGKNHHTPDLLSRNPQQNRKSAVIDAIEEITDAVDDLTIHFVTKRYLQDHMTERELRVYKETLEERPEINVIHDVQVSGKSHEVILMNGKDNNRWKKSINEVTVAKNIESAVSIEEWKRAQQSDKTCQQIASILEKARDGRLTKAEETKFQSELQRFTVTEQGIIVERKVHILKEGGEVIRKRAVVPESLKIRLLHYFHESFHGSHLGAREHIVRLKQLFYWPRLNTDIKEHVATCDACTKAKLGTKLKPFLMGTMAHQNAFQTILLDHKEIRARNKWNFSHVLCIMCPFTGWLIGEPVTSTSAEDTVEVLYRRLYCELGRSPHVAVCDNAFRQKECQKFAKAIGMEWKTLARYNPKGNSMERGIKDFGIQMRILVTELEKGQDKWPVLVPKLVKDLNMRRGSRGYSPFELTAGFQPETPLEKILYPISEKDLVDTSDESVFSELVKTLAAATAELRMTKIEQAEDRSLKRSRDPISGLHLLKPGDLVVKIARTRGDSELGTAKTLQYSFTGPHKVLRRFHDLHKYEVELASGRIAVYPGEQLRWIRPNHRRIPRAQIPWMKDMLDVTATPLMPEDVIAIFPLKQHPISKETGRDPVWLGVVISVDEEEEQPILVQLMHPQRISNRKTISTQNYKPLYVDHQNNMVFPMRSSRSVIKVTTRVRYQDVVPVGRVRLNNNGVMERKVSIQINKLLKSRIKENEKSPSG